MSSIFCKECGNTLKNIKALITHLRYHHSNISSKNYYDKHIKKNINENICLTCGKNTTYVSITKGYKQYCSTSCALKDPLIQDKIKKTNIIKFGVDNPILLKSIIDKRTKTNIAKWGASNPMKTEKGKKLRQISFNEKYKDGHPMRDTIVKNKLRNTCYIKYKVNTCIERASQIAIEKKRKKILNILEELDIQLLEDYKGNKKYHKFKCLKCNNIFESCISYIENGYGFCSICYPKYKSIAEQEIVSFINGLNFETINNNRKIIPPYEIDIYIPEKKIAIEYNGLYWHSENCGKDKNYHLNKLNKCLEKGINLIQIFEDEWLSLKDIVKSRLKQILGVNERSSYSSECNSYECNSYKRIHARKCIIKEIDSKVKNKFLDKFHLQGQDKSIIKLGAFYSDNYRYDNKLISVMTFSKGSIAKGAKYKEGIWELNRFCSDSNFHIPGIASKLLSYFKRNYSWIEIFSYADRRWSVGNLYFKLGFSLEHITKPNYWYVRGLSRIHRFSLRKKFNEPKDIPEWMLRLKEGYSRVWDCGHLKFLISKQRNNI